MLFFREKIDLGETRNFLYLNKFRRKNRIQKRFYRTNSLYFGKDKKIIEFVGITGTKIINILKVGAKNKVNKKDKLLSHQGGIIKPGFLDDNNLKIGVVMMTTKDEYKVKTEKNLIVKRDSIEIDNEQKLSKEIVLLNNNDVDMDKLNDSINLNDKINKKYKIKVETKFNDFFNKNNEIMWIHKDGIKDQKVSKNKIDKIIKLDDKIVYKIKKID